MSQYPNHNMPPCGRPPQHSFTFGELNYTAEQINVLLGMIPFKADRSEVPEMEKLSDVNYLGHVADATLLPEQEQPSWALVGNIEAARPYFFYVTDFVPKGYQPGWNDLSQDLGTYNLTALNDVYHTKLLCRFGSYEQIDGTAVTEQDVQEITRIINAVQNNKTVSFFYEPDEVTFNYFGTLDCYYNSSRTEFGCYLPTSDGYVIARCNISKPDKWALVLASGNGEKPKLKNYNSLTGRPAINGVTLSGNHKPAELDLATLTEFDTLRKNVSEVAANAEQKSDNAVSTSNEAKRISETAKSNSEYAVETSNEAKRISETAKNAVTTLQGLSNANEAMQTLAGQVVQIEENKQNIDTNKADTDAKLSELVQELGFSETLNIVAGEIYNQIYNIDIVAGQTYRIDIKGNAVRRLSFYNGWDAIFDFGSNVTTNGANVRIKAVAIASTNQVKVYTLPEQILSSGNVELSISKKGTISYDLEEAIIEQNNLKTEQANLKTEQADLSSNIDEIKNQFSKGETFDVNIVVDETYNQTFDFNIIKGHTYKMSIEGYHTSRLSFYKPQWDNMFEGISFVPITEDYTYIELVAAYDSSNIKIYVLPSHILSSGNMKVSIIEKDTVHDRIKTQGEELTKINEIRYKANTAVNKGVVSGLKLSEYNIVDEGTIEFDFYPKFDIHTDGTRPLVRLALKENGNAYRYEGEYHINIVGVTPTEAIFNPIYFGCYQALYGYFVNEGNYQTMNVANLMLEPERKQVASHSLFCDDYLTGGPVLSLRIKNPSVEYVNYKVTTTTEDLTIKNGETTIKQYSYSDYANSKELAEAIMSDYGTWLDVKHYNYSRNLSDIVPVTIRLCGLRISTDAYDAFPVYIMGNWCNRKKHLKLSFKKLSDKTAMITSTIDGVYVDFRDGAVKETDTKNWEFDKLRLCFGSTEDYVITNLKVTNTFDFNQPFRMEYSHGFIETGVNGADMTYDKIYKTFDNYKKAGYSFPSLYDFIKMAQSGKVNEKVCLFTFDDYRWDIWSYPNTRRIFQELNIQPILYIPIEGFETYVDEHDLQDIKELINAGWWVQPHSYKHGTSATGNPHWNAPYATFVEWMEKCNAKLFELGLPTLSFCPPQIKLANHQRNVLRYEYGYQLIIGNGTQSYGNLMTFNRGGFATPDLENEDPFYGIVVPRAGESNDANLDLL